MAIISWTIHENSGNLDNLYLNNDPFIMHQENPMRLSVKFCGLTRTEDVKTAVALGVDAVGLVFYGKSPRCVSQDVAKQLVADVPPFVSVVALLVNMTDDELVALAAAVPFDVIQFHGDETASDCQRLARLVTKRWYQALRVQPDDTPDTLLNKINELKEHGASGVLLDTYNPTHYGGTGEQFDWSKIPNNSPLPIYLAGGLTPENIGQITSNHELKNKIAGVDVSGGIEQAKGIKCGEKMRAFMNNITHQ